MCSWRTGFALACPYMYIFPSRSMHFEVSPNPTTHSVKVASATIRHQDEFRTHASPPQYVQILCTVFNDVLIEPSPEPHRIMTSTARALTEPVSGGFMGSVMLQHGMDDIDGGIIMPPQPEKKCSSCPQYFPLLYVNFGQSRRRSKMQSIRKCENGQ